MKFKALIFLAVLVAAMGLVFFVGCDDSNNSNDLVISPSATMIAEGQTIAFTVENGDIITWSIDNSSLGTFVVTGANTINYTSHSPTDSGQVQILHAHSVKADDPSATKDAQATITSGAVNATPAPTSTNGVTALTINASTNSASLSFPKTIFFQATGGTAAFTWTVAPTGSGSFSQQGQNSTIFTPLLAGTSTVTCTDGVGQQDSVSITITL